MDILFVFVCQIFSTGCTINGERGRWRGVRGLALKISNTQLYKKNTVSFIIKPQMDSDLPPSTCWSTLS